MSGALAALLYLPGITRAFDYDDAITAKYFVFTRSMLDPLRRQIANNNHVGFSFLEHLVFSITHSTSEWVMRLAPMLAAAACIGIVVAAVARRSGLVVAVLAGGLLATNPLFLTAARTVRGYSLMTLCAVASTLLLLDLERRSSRQRGAAYIALIAVGLTAQLYMLVVVVGHIVLLGARRAITPQWRARWLAGTLIGGVAYLGVARAMADANQTRVFRPQFPLELSRELLGGQPVAVALTALGVAVALWPLRHRRETIALAGFFTIIVAALWLFAPQHLYARFFVWATPAVAVAAAHGLYRLRYGAALAVSAATLALLPNLSAYTDDHYANRVAAEEVSRLRRPDDRVCSIGWPTESLPVYLPDVNAVVTKRELDGCQIVVALDPHDRPDLRRAALARFPHARRLDADIDGYLIWRD